MSVADTLFEEFKQAIMEGRYPPGSRIPSIRETASARKCNKLTVKRAYDRLKEEGLIENSVGRGTYVRFPRRLETGSGVFSFQTASVGEELFLLEEAGELTENLFAEEGAALFSAAPPGGDPGFIETLSRFYRTPKERTVVISGAQQGLDLAGRLFQGPVSDSVLFEEPTYSGAINLFRPRLFVPLFERGPDLDTLTSFAEEGIDAFYTMPQIHNPTGITYDRSQMERIAELSLQYDFLIIEDDYLSEFLPDFFDDPPVRFLDLVPERTIYIKSLSKVTAPGIRLGLLVAPGHLKEELLFNKFTADIGTSTYMQKFVRAFVEKGLLEKSIRNNRRKCAVRRKAVESMLDRFPFLHYVKGGPGYNIWIRSDKDPNIPGAPWAGGDNFSFNPRHREYLRLSFMGLPDDRFTAGLEYLAKFLEGLGENGPRGIY